MTTNEPQRWAALRAHFERLVEMDAASRERALGAIRADDAPLAAELASLLEHDDGTGAADDAPVTSRVIGAVQRLAADLGLDAERARPAWIGDYRIVDTLGSGGMGVVYLAEQSSPRRTVALKVVRGVGAERSIRRFRREAELHGRLQHPNIAQVFEAGMARERDAAGREHGAPRPYFAMEFVRGESLVADAARRRLPVADRVRLVALVAQAIDHAHARGVVHRDLKSANILVDEHGRPKVLDFGIARALDRDHAATVETAAGEVVGTLPYMSPEQVAGRAHEIDARSDVYALGVVLFELLTGRRPLELSGRALPDAVRIVMDEEPTRLGRVDRSLRGDLETIVARCLEKSPARRYPSAGALADDLRRFLDHRPIEARPASTLYQVGKFARRHRPLVTGLLTAFAALAAATAISVVMAVRAHRAQVDAERAGEQLKEQLRASGIENARATQSFAFLADLLTAADPSRGIGPATTVRELVLRAAAALEAGAGGDNQVTGSLAHLIGVTLMRLGEAESAERVLKRSVELLSIADPAAVTPEAALFRAMASLSQLLRERGRMDEAEVVLRNMVELRRENIRRTGGREIPGVTPQADYYRSVAMNDLALIMAGRGDHAGAESMAMRAYEMEKALVDMGHDRRRAMAITLWNVGENRRKQRRHADAVPALEQAHAIAVAAEGAEGSVALRIGLALGASLTTLGRCSDAAAVLEPVVAIRRQQGNDLDAALAESYLQATLAMDGEALRSLELATSVVERYRRAEAPPIDLVRAEIALAAALAAVGEHAASAEAFDAAAARLERSLGPDHELSVDLDEKRARSARLAGRIDDAIAWSRAAIESAARRDPGDARSRESAQREWALSLAASADPAVAREGVEQLESCIDRLRAEPVDEPPMLARIELARAEALFALGDAQGAAIGAEQAARAFSDDAGHPRWLGEYAALLALAAREPRSIGTLDVEARVAAVRREIERSAGAASPDLERLARLAAPGSRPARRPRTRRSPRHRIARG